MGVTHSMNEKSTAEGLPKPAKNSARALLASVVTAEISDMCTPRVKKGKNPYWIRTIRTRWHVWTYVLLCFVIKQIIVFQSIKYFYNYLLMFKQCNLLCHFQHLYLQFFSCKCTCSQYHDFNVIYVLKNVQ